MGAAASFSEPMGLALSLDGKLLFISDASGPKIRMVNVADRTVTTFAGSGERVCEDGVGTAASFHRPLDLSLSGDGKLLFFADDTRRYCRKIRAVNVDDGAVTTLDASEFRNGSNVALHDGKLIFSDWGKNKICGKLGRQDSEHPRRQR